MMFYSHLVVVSIDIKKHKLAKYIFPFYLNGDMYENNNKKTPE